MKDWPEIEGFHKYDKTAFAGTKALAFLAVVYKKNNTDIAYRWIICPKNGDIRIQTDEMSMYEPVGIQCKTLDEAVATINALAALGVKT